jgi:hypothetical protein
LPQDRASRGALEAPNLVLPAQNGAVRRKKALTIIVSNQLAKTIVVEINQKTYLHQAINSLLSNVRSPAFGPKLANDDLIYQIYRLTWGWRVVG